MKDLNIKILSGSATADEVAAVVAVISAISTASSTNDVLPASSWSNPAALHRKQLPTKWSHTF